MSAHDEHGEAQDDGHDDHGHAFDPEPTTELSAGEPQSPLWLPAVGVVFFALVGLWSMTGDDADAAAPPANLPAKAIPKAAPKAAAAPPRRPATPPKRPALTKPPAPGDAHGIPDMRQKLSPETVRKLKERLEAHRGNNDK